MPFRASTKAPGSLRFRLLLIVVAFIGPLLCLQLWNAVGERQAAILAAQDQMLQFARTAAAREDDSLQEAVNLLRVLARVPEVRDNAVGDCHALLREIVNEHPRIGAIAVTRRDGSASCISNQPVPGPYSLKDRGWFREATEADAPSIVISEFLVSRLSNRPTVIVATPLRPADSEILANAVISVSLNLDWLSDIAARFATPLGATVLVMDTRDGAVLARSEASEEWVGRHFPQHPFVAALRQQSEGTLRIVGIDGVEQIAGFARLPGDVHTNAVVAVSIPRSTVLLSANAHLLQALSAALLMLLLGISAAALIVTRSLTRPLGSLLRLAQRLGRGELSARVELHELAVEEFQILGAALNAAAAEIQERDKILAELASRDGLTGLLNRRAGDDLLLGEWNRARRAGTSLAVAMIDLDQFKLLNDDYGHAAGDACLKQVSTSITNALRSPSDSVARYGGEEIVLIMPDTDIDQAKLVADRLVRLIRSLAITNANSVAGVVTVSIGVAATINAGPRSSPGALLAAADAALYMAKAQGRDQAVANRRDASQPAALDASQAVG